MSQLLNSLLTQTWQDLQVLVRDDGSTDSTCTLLRQYAEQNEGKIRLLADDEGNVGPKRAFELLLGASSAPYVMFCDQDDVWLPEKVSAARQAMKQAEAEHPGVPLVVATDLKVVDENLNEIAPSFWKYSHIKQALLCRKEYAMVNPVTTGCTMMLNRMAARGSLPFAAEARMHDSWVTLKTLLAGGRLVALSTPYILYRQHGGNQIGAIEMQSSYLKKKMTSLGRVWHDNAAQWRMLKAAGYGSLARYLFYKFYFLTKQGER